MHSVEKNISIPKAIRQSPPSRRKYPFDTMEVGDMFFVPDREKNNLAAHTSTMGKKLKRKFVTRLTHMCEEKESWVSCDPSEENAVMGIGVWRTT